MSGSSAKRTGKKYALAQDKIIRHLACGVPGIQVHLIENQVSENKRKITAYLISADTGKRLPEATTHTHQYDPHVSHPASERQHFANRLGTEFQKENRMLKIQKSKKGAATIGPLRQAYYAYLESQGCEPDSDLRFLIRFNQRWSEQTNRKAITYFERQLLPVFDDHLQKQGAITYEDMDTLFEAQVQKTVESKKSTGQYVVVRRSVEQEFLSAMRIYSEIQQDQPEYELPELHFRATSRKSTPGTEQVKSLTDPIRIKLAVLLLYRLPPVGPACGLALMLFGGLRTAEAAAPRFGEITVCGDHAIYTVCTQVRKRERDSKLKTDAAYRTIVLPYVFVAFYQKAVTHLQGLGNSDAEIAEMPFVTDGVSLDLPIRPPALSEFIRKVLLRCGCSEGFLEGQRLDMGRCPDYDLDGCASRDISAYVLRRDYVTRLANRCGMPMATLDYLLGHRRKENTIRDFESPDAQTEIAMQLERFVFLPDHSRNPAHAPLVVSEGKPLVMPEPYEQMTLTTGSKGVTCLSLQAKEPGVPIECHLPKGTSVKKLERHLSKDTAEKRRYRPVLGRSVTNHQQAIQEALALDLTTIEEGKK